jgi:hypothetical protein
MARAAPLVEELEAMDGIRRSIGQKPRQILCI